MSRHQMGEFRRRLTKLRLETTPEEIVWRESDGIWAKAERRSGGNIFSSVGLSAESWTFTIRAQDLTTADALRLGLQHHFITSIEEELPGFFTVQTARVNIVQCQADLRDGGLRFPAALTEKYIRHDQQLPPAVNTSCFVLVTPKQVDLKEGSLVDVAGEAYCVQIGHRLDAVKNEFEIVRARDL